ncbi:MAG: hypothetical protein GX767_08755 [Firmicutes bacterium]|nr:hypothetical protein [Bacillota bacterium]
MKIRRELLKKGINLTEQQIRTRIKYLKESQLIESYNGKGTTITNRGKDMLLSSLQIARKGGIE